MTATRFDLLSTDDIPSPALLYDIRGIRENIAKAVAIAENPARLWPHVKTHKLSQVAVMQQEAGIQRFKCATIAEAEMLAMCGAQDILLAYPLVGPAVDRFLLLQQRYPEPNWWALADDIGALSILSERAEQAGLRPFVLADVDVGMHRTGLRANDLPDFFAAAQKLPGICMRGLHVYDGHIHDRDPQARQESADAVSSCVLRARRDLASRGYLCDTVILGGTPTFPCHARRADVFLSPGTLIVHDYGYLSNYPDLDFTPSAALLTRVISRPSSDLFTVDLGCKAIAADPDGPRGFVANLPKARSIAQSEEHWVFSLAGQPLPRLGDVLYVIPTHICPTTALHSHVLAIEDGRVIDRWNVTARDRILTI